MDLAEFIDDKGFRFFKGIELARYADRVHAKSGVKNSLPPRHLWASILSTLEVADKAREALGSPIVITSSYRSPEYNKAVGGASKSQHMQHTALDLVPREASPQKLFDILWKMRVDGFFRGGLGLYNASGFVHVDTRGKNATWGK